jgi:hypothetical protein
VKNFISEREIPLSDLLSENDCDTEEELFDGFLDGGFTYGNTDMYLIWSYNVINV